MANKSKEARRARAEARKSHQLNPEPSTPHVSSTPEEANQALSDMAKVISMKEQQEKKQAKKTAPKEGKAAKSKGLTAFLPSLPKAKSKKDRPVKPCECGCGDTTKSRFAPGHDSNVRGAAIRIEKGVLTLDQFESIMVKDAGKTREQAKAMRDAVEGELQKRAEAAKEAKKAERAAKRASAKTGTSNETVDAEAEE